MPLVSTKMRSTVWMTVVLLLGTLGLWAPAGAQEKPKTDSAGATVPGPFSSSDYIIGADDMLHVSVWKEAELTVTLPVRPDGKISLPLIHDVQAAGLTPVQLSESIAGKLKKYLSDPRVSVEVTQMNSQRVFVIGEVLRGGPVPLLPGMTVLQALGSAGFTQFANTRGIYVLRVEAGKQTKIPIRYKQALRGNTEQNIPLKPGDTVVVP